MQNALSLIASTLLAVSSAALADESPRIFVTSVSGTGELSSWLDAGGRSGLDAADAICRSRATAGGLEDADAYVALLSDDANDAYCRLHGVDGKVADRCGLPVLPTGAGPWYRMDGLAQRDVLSTPTGSHDATGYVPRPIAFDETGAPVDSQATAFTGSDGQYVASGDNCADWSDGTGTDDDVSLGYPWAGLGDISASTWRCAAVNHLVCARSGVFEAPLTRSTSASGRVAFFTSQGGNGNLSSWPDAAGTSGLAAGDAICRAHASRAHLARADTFKAWLSTATIDAIDRFVFDGPIERPDAVRVADSLAGLASGFLQAPIQIDEHGATGPFFFEDVWTGTGSDGRFRGYDCAAWTSSSTNEPGHFGQTYLANSGWTAFVYEDLPMSCDAQLTPMHLYCIGDNDSLFVAGFE